MEKTFLNLKFIDIFYNFFIYSFFGWIYESLYVSIRKKTWVNRGFLNGPVIPIYGFGATFFYIMFHNSHMVHLTRAFTLEHVTILYIVGMVSATFLEYVTSYFMEKIFHAKWWDYSDYKYNIQGRISLIPSLFWGFLSIIMAYIIQPKVSKLTNKITSQIGWFLGIIILLIFIVDFLITVVATLQLHQKLQLLESLREDLYEYAEGLKWYEVREELKIKLRNLHVREFLKEFRKSLDKSYEHFQTKQKLLSLKGLDRVHYVTEIEDKIKEFKSIYMSQSHNRLQKNIYNRLFKAFPNLKMNNQEGVFEDFKEKVQRKISNRRTEISKTENKKQRKKAK